MSVILIFIVFVVIGDTAAVYISYLFERVSNFTSLMVFLVLFAMVFYVAWQLAVRVAERYFIRQH
jgi:lipopolysaccharide export LptBFGC system permease protein LptF